MDELQPYLDIAELAGKFLKGEITGEERARLFAWIEQDYRHRLLWEKLTREAYLQQQLDSFNGEDPGAAWQKLLSAIRSAPEEKAPPKRVFLRYAIAAATLIGLLCVGLKWFTKTPPPKPVAVVKTLDDIHPGAPKAKLVLGNGRVVNLVAGARDTIKESDGSQAATEKNELRYAAAGGDIAVTNYNSVLTPRGGEYTLVLSDGTKVWLNAASSIRFPTRFTGKERRVFLEGEAYLEVQKDAGHPFIVTTPKTEITVLGTSFNVKSYADEPYDRTSLVDGSVRITTQTGSAILQPGMQSMVTTGGRIQTSDADLEEALAWKNGQFVFQHESLESICRKLSRWYNVDFVFQNLPSKNLHFTGRLKRDDQITGLLRALESTCHVHFEQSGLKLTVE